MSHYPATRVDPGQRSGSSTRDVGRRERSVDRFVDYTSPTVDLRSTCLSRTFPLLKFPGPKCRSKRRLIDRPAGDRPTEGHLRSQSKHFPVLVWTQYTSTLFLRLFHGTCLGPWSIRESFTTKGTGTKESQDLG